MPQPSIPVSVVVETILHLVIIPVSAVEETIRPLVNLQVPVVEKATPHQVQNPVSVVEKQHSLCRPFQREWRIEQRSIRYRIQCQWWIFK